jgi:hypothetical protein
MSQSKEIVAAVKQLPYFKAIKNRRKRAFLAAYARSGNISEAAVLAKCDWRNHYWWLDKDEDYKQAFERAKEIAADLLEGQMFDAVMNGDDLTIAWNGRVTDTYKRKSDVLRMFMMKGLKPQYRDNFNVAAVSGPVSISITYPNKEKDVTHDQDMTKDNSSLAVTDVDKP